jgi:thiamine biosynthesis lipoprotein
MPNEGPTGVIPPGHKQPAQGHGNVPVRRMRMGLGTWVVIEASGCSAACALQGLENAFARIRHVEGRMHPQREGSDLVRLRQAPLGTAVAIDASTRVVLTCAQQLFRLSQGVFDPCLPHSAGRLCDLELSPDPETPWARASASLDIDCGGIAKGYAVDCALEALRASGCSAGLVNAGGDVRVYGPQPQTLLLRRADGSYIPCELHEAALAVSDLDAATPPAEHRGYYVRERAGGAVRRYAAVRAPEAMVADALTKCVVLCAPALADALARQMSAEILA